jgi:hypothetical protein
MYGYSKVQSTDPNEQTPDTLANKILSTVLLGGASYVLFNKHSEIVFEGDTLNVFGLFSFNPLAERWEIEYPIAFMKDCNYIVMLARTF